MESEVQEVFWRGVVHRGRKDDLFTARMYREKPLAIEAARRLADSLNLRSRKLDLAAVECSPIEGLVSDE